MPELPEVENIKEKLWKAIANKKIEDVTVNVPRIVRTPDVDRFKTALKGQTFRAMNRKGKYLIFVLDNMFLVSHLRMEGKYLVTTSDSPLNKHDHVIFHLENGEELRYNDVRKFGTMDVVDDIDEIKGVAELGPEPLSEALDGNYLLNKLQNKNTSIKNALLDQRIVAGLGNIYVDEVLFDSFIHPKRKASDVTLKECEALCVSIRNIISLAITKGGSTIRSYTSMGEEGDMQNFHKVYGKTNTPCIRCQTTIEKTKVGGRGTHFCPSCQTI